MADVSEFLLLGVVLGLVQGVSPGPLVTLVISETLKFGKKEGFKVAVSPLISDSTVVVLALVVLSNLAQNALFIGTVSLLGAGYLIYLAWDNLRVKTAILEAGSAKRGALKRALVTNFLNPMSTFSGFRLVDRLFCAVWLYTRRRLFSIWLVSMCF